MTAPLKTIEGTGDVAGMMRDIGRGRAPAARMSGARPGRQKNARSDGHGHGIRARRKAEILAANAEDVAEAKASMTPALSRPADAHDAARRRRWRPGIEVVAALPDPVGTVTESWTRPNGMTIERVRVPLGVIGIIYESRPNVTADAGALCLKAGNAAILRGGSDSLALVARHPRRAGPGSARSRTCRKTPSSWCRRATAPRSA